MPRLTIIYPYRNRDVIRLERSLQSLRQQSASHPFDILLVDYGSSPEQQLAIKDFLKRYPEVKYIFNQTEGMPWSRSHALNTGIKMADSEFVFSADVDMIFDNAFIKTLYRQMDSGKAYFYMVGYLPRHFDYSRSVQRTDYQRSQNFALGLALLPRQAVDSIGGYDEFYCFWGNEDNDMHYRLQASGISCTFYDEQVLLYHQWHEPANTDMPGGWRTCMSEYFELNKGQTVRNDNSWGRVYDESSRPSLQAFRNSSVNTAELSCRKSYFEWWLVSQLQSCKSGETLKGRLTDVHSTLYLQSKPARIAACFEKAMNLVNLPVEARTAYHYRFFTVKEARDSFFFFFHFHRQLLADFYFDDTHPQHFDFAFTLR